MTIKDKLNEKHIDDKELVERIKKELNDNGENATKITNKLTLDGEKIVDEIIKEYKENLPKKNVARPTSIKSYNRQTPNTINSLNANLIKSEINVNSTDKEINNSTEMPIGTPLPEGTIEAINRGKIDSQEGQEKSKIELEYNIECIKTKYNQIFLEFIKRLKEEDNLKPFGEFLERIKNVAEYDIDKIDNEEYKCNIDKKIIEIKEFIDNYKGDYYQIGLIEGFRRKGNINRKDYYYYIADQQCKANVYYLRYINFLNEFNKNDRDCECEISDNIKKIESSKKDIFESLHPDKKSSLYKNTDIDNSKGNINTYSEYVDDINTFIGCVEKEFKISSEQNNSNTKILDDIKENVEEIQLCIANILKSIENIKANRDLNYKVYMLFNNMMREIRYYGISYQYLWHWELKTKNLFRCEECNNTKNVPQTKQENENNNKKEFMENVFKMVISHMNGTCHLKSYSEDPYIDIFKYLRIKKNECINSEVIYEDNSKKIEVLGLNNKNFARFEIINETSINAIKKNNEEAKSFYNFILDNEPTSNNTDTSFSVELYPKLPEAEQNEKETTKNIKSLLFNYLVSWSENPKHVMSYVADDKEVVVKGDMSNDIINVTKVDYQYKKNCKYVMKFSKEEIIYLIIKLFGFEDKIKEIIDDIDILYNEDDNYNKPLDNVFDNLYQFFPIYLPSKSYKTSPSSLVKVIPLPIFS